MYVRTMLDVWCTESDPIRVHDLDTHNALQVLDVIEAMFTHMFKGLETACARELKEIGIQHPFSPFVMKPMRFTYAEGVKV